MTIIGALSTTVFHENGKFIATIAFAHMKLCIVFDRHGRAFARRGYCHPFCS